MEEVIVEILEKADKVKERFRFNRLPITIGRDYRNDIIVDDAYISPNHVQIKNDEHNNLVIEDLGSENGLFIHALHKKINLASLHDDNLFQIGNTIIRIRKANFKIAPTMIDRRRSMIGRRLAATPWLFILIACVIGGLTFLNTSWNSFTETKPLKIIVDILPIILIWMTWAGIWSLISKIFTHRFFYYGHAIFSGSAVVAYMLMQIVYDYLSFIFSGGLFVDIFEVLGSIIIVGSLLYAHLRACTISTQKFLITVTYSFASAVLGIFILIDYTRNTEFSDRLDYPAGLKPLAFKITKSESLDQFIKESELLKEKVLKSTSEN